MKKIFIRSPYSIETTVPAEFNKVIVQLYLWNKGETEPVLPTYVVEKDIPSSTKRDLTVNVSNYAKEFIKSVAPDKSIVNRVENPLMFCFMKAEIVYGETVTSETFVCLNGYTDYSLGYNQSSIAEILPLFNPDVIYNNEMYLNIWVDAGFDFYWSTQYGVTSDGNVYKLPLEEGKNTFYKVASPKNEEVFTVMNALECEGIYTPMECSYINRFGGWETIVFYKAKSERFEVQSKDFKSMQATPNYNPLIGQKQKFNFEANKTVKVNSGWVEENNSELLENLLTSETVLLDNKPVIVKTRSFDYKTRLKDRNINYEIEFEYNYDFINNQI